VARRWPSAEWLRRLRREIHRLVHAGGGRPALRWWRVTFLGPEMSADARHALDVDDVVHVHDRVDATEDERHTVLAYAASAEGAIDLVQAALDGQGRYGFFEAWPFPPPSVE
jgi:hypothetical protein